MADAQEYTYKNVSEVEQTLLGVGVVKPGATCTVNEPFDNPNFELADKKKADKDNSSETEK